jgi:hypothetical protein
MHRIALLLGLLTVLLAVGGSARAGYWEVDYDLTGSTVVTIIPLLPTIPPDTDPLTGTFTIQYDTPGTATTPITGARLVAGASQVIMSQTWGGLFLLTGTTDTTLLPPAPLGTTGMITGATLSGFTAVPTTVMGFIHCTDGTFPCAQANFTHSVPKPQVATPVNLGKFVFTGAVGTSDFNSTGALLIVTTGPAPVHITTTYVGKEISRNFVPEPTRWIQMMAGAACLLVLYRRGRRPTGRPAH